MKSNFVLKIINRNSFLKDTQFYKFSINAIKSLMLFSTEN